jgi:DNA invertase Pin-like site-specific DNA recombinase
MAVNGQSKITPSHRARLALVYVRQSTLVQVREHTESTARQYGLAAVAIELGWPAASVVVVDADLGSSGRFGSRREGFRELVSQVCLGEVGAVFGLEVSRLARSSAEFTRLLELSRLTDTLLVDGDGVYDLGDVNDRLLLGLKGTMSEAELHLLVGRLHGAKLAAAARGELRFPLPVGYVYDRDGVCVIDPDAEVSAAVADLFAAFDATGSAYKVAGEFTGRRFPLRAYGGAWAGQLRWGRLGHARVLDALTNPCYAGAYVYGRSYMERRVLPDGSVRSTRRYRPRDQWPLLLRDHHEGYLTWQQFLGNEAKLAANHTKAGARPAREGHPLCQGIIYCGACGFGMGTQYRWGKHVAYSCTAARRDGAASPACRQVPVATVDQAVSQLLLAAVKPEQISLALAAAGEVATRHTRAHRAAELAAERARYDADRAERAFGLVEPENRLVARALEARWEARLAALTEAEAALATARAAKPPLAEAGSLLALAADLPRLWNAPQTSSRDRKRLLRAVISDITLIPQDDPTLARVGIRWHTGATDQLTLKRPGPGCTPPEAVELVRRQGATTTDEVLAGKLNAAGLTTGKHRPFDAAAVARIRATYTIPAPRTVPLREGEITVPDAAGRLGVAADAIYYWLTNGQLPARQAPSGRWCIPWNPQTEAAYRAQVAASFRLKPRTQPALEGSAV